MKPFHSLLTLCVIGLWIEGSVAAQGFYAVSRPTIMQPARGVFFGPVLARPATGAGIQGPALVQSKSVQNTETRLAKQKKQALEEQKRIRKLQQLWALARQGNPKATFELAGIYEKGDGLPAQPALSQRLLYQAARMGYPPALAQWKQRSQKKR